MVIAIWGSTFVFTKLLLLGGLTAAQIFILRFIIAYALLLGYCLVRGIRWVADSWRDELLMAALGVTGGSLYFLTENSSMNYTTTTNTSIIVSLCPLFASAIIGLFYKTERLSRLQTFGTLMAAAGVIVVVMNGHFVLHLSPRGDLLAFAACLCWAIYSLLMIPANARYDTVFVTRKVFFYGLLSMIPYYIIYPELNLHLVLQQPQLLWNLLFLGCVASMLCFLTWNWVLKKLGAVVATNYVYLNPVTTIIFAWFLLGGIFLLSAAGFYTGIITAVPGWARALVLIVLAAAIAVFALFEIRIASCFGMRAEPGMDYIIVLGAQVKENGPSVVLKYRLDAAYDYLTANPETKCIVTGSQGSNEPVTEAAGMQAYLVSRGIDASRIILEEQADNTVQNLVYSRELIDSEDASAAIVTNNFHLFRALHIAAAHGYRDVQGISAYSTALYLPNNMVREFFGVCKDLVRGDLEW